nr:Ribonuclease III domain [uncultured bacterium]
MATAFEALIGYLYLSGEEQRLEEVMAEAVRIIENTKGEKQ